MTNQEQNREALIRHIADLEAIIRRRNEQIDNQAHNARETQQALEQIARERDEARRERDSWRAQVPLADWEKDLIQATETPRRLTPDAITDEMVERALPALRRYGIHGSLVPHVAREMLAAALTDPPARPEGAEDIEALILDYKRENAHRGYSEAEIADYVAARLTDPTRKEA